METLSYGYKKPETNDSGAVVFPALEDNIQRLNDHTHDGANSSKLPGSSIESTVESVLATNWGSDLGGGYYKQTVNMPTGFDFDYTQIQVRLSTGHIMQPTIIRLSTAQFDIYVNDNTIDLVVLFN